MNDLLSSVTDLSPALAAALGGAVGLVLGFVHFRSLWVVTRLYAEGRTGRALGLQALRLAGLALVLYGMARIGTAALIAALPGLLIARWVLLRRNREGRP